MWRYECATRINQFPFHACASHMLHRKGIRIQFYFHFEPKWFKNRFSFYFVHRKRFWCRLALARPEFRFSFDPSYQSFTHQSSTNNILRLDIVGNCTYFFCVCVSVHGLPRTTTWHVMPNNRKISGKHDNDLWTFSFSCTNSRFNHWSYRGQSRRHCTITMHNSTVKSASRNKMDGQRSADTECNIKNSCFARRYVELHKTLTHTYTHAHSGIRSYSPFLQQ